jgi:hypothetical protein
VPEGEENGREIGGADLGLKRADEVQGCVARVAVQIVRQNDASERRDLRDEHGDTVAG